MVRDTLRVLAVVLALLAATAGGYAAEPAPPAGALSLQAPPADGGGGGGGRFWRWADQYLNPFSDGSPSTTRRPSCGATDCGFGTQCCCCGGRCYCKKECSLEPCGDGR